MIKAIAVDDDLIALRVIENFCKAHDFIQLEKTFNDPVKALKHTKKYPVDVVFLDIDMPVINGIEFSKKLDQEIMVIFTSTHTDFAIEGFNLNAVDFIAKPYTYERFEQALAKARVYFTLKSQQDSNHPKYLFLRANYALHKISIPEIVLIEALDDYLKIHLEGKNKLVVRMTLKAIEKKLPAKDFIQTHRSFIVSVPRIEKIGHGKVTVAGMEIPIGAKYEDQLMGLLS